MEDRFVEENLRQRLILFGLRELSERGVSDFSLRRVALAAQVSCAAPYRHFKGKEELILAVVRYVRDGWFMLARQISEVFSSRGERLVELCVSGVRFWCGNGDFRSIMLLDSAEAAISEELSLFDKPLTDALYDLGLERGMAEEQIGELSLFLLALYRGTVMLVASGRVSADRAVEGFRARLKKEFSL